MWSTGARLAKLAVKLEGVTDVRQHLILVVESSPCINLGVKCGTSVNDSFDSLRYHCHEDCEVCGRREKLSENY